MRPKEFPEIFFDVIPKLYEPHYKVFITHLGFVEQQLKRLPQNYCRMYTTRRLADQLLHYLRERDPNCSMERDFFIVQETQPFKLRLQNGRVLECMLCAGNELANSLMVLIRKPQGGPLLYYYSAVQQDDLCRLMGNRAYNEWIAEGTEVLYLNLQAAEEKYEHVDFDAVAKAVAKFGRDRAGKTLLKFPLFGYEYLVKQLSKRLYGNMCLLGVYEQSYRLLGADMQCFERSKYADLVHVYATTDWDDEDTILQLSKTREFPLKQLIWSPLPTRMNLIQLCSLLRPRHISGIVDYQAQVNAPPAPQYLQRYRINYTPKTAPLNTSNETSPVAVAMQKSPTGSNPSPSGTQLIPQKLSFNKPRNICNMYVDDDDSD